MLSGASLAVARRTARRSMPDEVRITRDTHGYLDDVLDIATGGLLPVDAQAPVYSGPGAIARVRAERVVEGAKVLQNLGYRLRLPWDAPHIQAGDTVEVVRSTDPELAGVPLEATAASVEATHVVTRVVPLRRREGDNLP